METAYFGICHCDRPRLVPFICINSIADKHEGRQTGLSPRETNLVQDAALPLLTPSDVKTDVVRVRQCLRRSMLVNPCSKGCLTATDCFN